MKTLYVSDLDGTLLQPDAKLSELTVSLLSQAIMDGKNFTIATARTPATVAPIMQPLSLQLPAIVMTGASMWDAKSGDYSEIKYLQECDVIKLLDIYEDTGTSSFLYTLDHNMIDIYHVGGEMTELQHQFMMERIHNPFKRFHIGAKGERILPDDLSKVILMYTMLPDAKAFSTFGLTQQIPGVRPQYYHDFYGPEIGILEAFSASATKANAIRSLAEAIGADRIVAFGDNINDLPMLRMADVAVAVENALPEVKEVADIVIGPNTDDSVAKFIISEKA